MRQKTQLLNHDPTLPKDAFDAVIIGSGMGGLSSAAILAKEGFRVCVLEQHYRLGGCLHRFFRDRVPFDTGFHYFGGIGENGTLTRYLRYFGVHDKLKFHLLDDDGFDVFQFPELTFRVPNGWARFAARLSELFPKEREGIAQFVAACEEICADSPAYSFKPPSMVSGRFATTTVKQFLDQTVKDPRAQAVLLGNSMLYGVEPSAAPLELHALVIDSMLQGAAGIDGGGDALAKAMADSIRAMGGTVRIKSRVDRLVTDVNKRIVRARLANGEEISGRVFIHNGHPASLVKMLPDDALPPGYRARLTDLKNGVGCIGGYFVAKERRGERRNHNIYTWPGWDIEAAYQTGGFGTGMSPEKGIFITFPADRDVGWKGPPVILALGLMRWDDVKQWAGGKTGERGPEYDAFKAEQGRLLQACVEKAVPEYAGALEAIEFSTPLSNVDYTASPEGSIYGIRRSMDQWGRYGLHARTKIDNLLLTGQNVLMPGVVGVTVGGAVTCAFLLGYDYLFGKIAKA